MKLHAQHVWLFKTAQHQKDPECLMRKNGSLNQVMIAQRMIQSLKNFNNNEKVLHNRIRNIILICNNKNVHICKIFKEYKC